MTVTRTCTMPECGNKLVARGLCSTHYNRTRYTKEARHAKFKTACATCGTTVFKDIGSAKKYSRHYCSYECRSWAQMETAGTDRTPIPKWHPAHPSYIPPLPVLWVPRPPKQPARRVFAMGTCRTCDNPFLAEDYSNTASYCSRRCARRTHKDTRRARLRNAYVERVVRTRIYARDGWRCQLCRRPVKRDALVPHPKAPVLDHIIPLAQGGTHEPTNVQCAHFWCNSHKGDRYTYPQQPTLF